MCIIYTLCYTHCDSEEELSLMDYQDEEDVSSGERASRCAACNAMEQDDAECRDCCLKCVSLWMIIVDMFIQVLTILKS